ncbi:hypothetical protein BGZ47_001480, partial [Haplosporangium gracile]
DYEEVLAKDYTITNTRLGKKYGISSDAAVRIIKEKDSILRHIEESPNGSKERKRLYKRNMQPVEEALFRWFLKQRNMVVNVFICINKDEKALRGQALVIWTEMKPLFRSETAPKGCTFSSGWCTSFNFKNDRGIKFRTGHGESGSVDLEADYPSPAKLHLPHTTSGCWNQSILQGTLSQEMLQDISWMTLRSRAVVRTIQNAKLWPCFASSWEKVTPGCIHKCLAKVATMSRVQADELKELGIEFAHHQVEDLQTELIEKYRHLEDTIASQTDIGVLNSLAMVDCEGPDEAMMEAVRETMSADWFKEIFHQSIEIESEDEEDDSDFELFFRRGPQFNACAS